MRRTLIALAFATLAVPGAAQATEADESIQVGTPTCYVQVDYGLNPGVVVDPSRPPYVHFVMCPWGCFGVHGAGVHCPI